MTVERKWGYQKDGSARVFAIRPGEKLPGGWSEDVNVIADAAKRTGEAVSTAAGLSIDDPVIVSRETEKEMARESATRRKRVESTTLRYDGDNNPISPDNDDGPL